MALLPILEVPDPRLRQKSTPLDAVTGETRQLIADMFETMYEAPGIGLAAIQVGVAKRVIGKEGPMPLADFERVIAINLIGTFNALRLAGAAMQNLEPLQDGERGIIVCTASVAAYEGQIGQAAYSASKSGVIGLNLTAARDLASSGIRVMTIAPGLVDTPMLATVSDEFRAALAESVTFPKRLAKAEEFASLALSIIANDYLNGEVIRMDGALRMGPR